MNEPETEKTNKAESSVFAGASLENGGGLLDCIAASPPAPEPDLVAHRAAQAASGSGGGDSAATLTNEADHSANEAEEGKTLRVDPKDYSAVKDHKGRPFDPTMHKVKVDGSPDFNARGRVKMLQDGEKNPVKLIFDPLGLIRKKVEEERAPEECEAQAASIVSADVMLMNAECVADMYAGVGFVVTGSRFTKGWERGRRQKLVTSLVHYERQTGQMMKVMPWMILANAFATDIALASGGEMFDSGGGLLGFFKKLRMKRGASKLQKASKGVHDAS